MRIRNGKRSVSVDSFVSSHATHRTPEKTLLHLRNSIRKHGRSYHNHYQSQTSPEGRHSRLQTQALDEDITSHKRLYGVPKSHTYRPSGEKRTSQAQKAEEGLPRPQKLVGGLKSRWTRIL